MALLCGLSGEASAQRGTDAPARVYGLEMEARGGRERVLIFADKELARIVEAPRSGTLRVRLSGSVLADSAPRDVVPAIEGAIREVRAREVVVDGLQAVEVEIDHAPGLQARVSNQGAIVAVEFPQFVRPDTRGFALHFENEPLAKVVDALARETGERYLYDDRLAGNVTILAPDRVSAEEALALLDAALFLRRFAAVKGPGEFRKIVPIDQVPAMAPWDPETPGPEREAPVTTLVRLERADVEEVVRTLAPAVGNTGLAVPLYESRSVILAGNEAQLHRWLVMAQALDRADVDEIRILRLRHRTASEVAPLLLDLTRDNQNPADDVSIWVDERSNALVVRARPSRFGDIRYWVDALDQREEGGGVMQVIRLRNADPEDLAEHLRALGSSAAAGGGEREPGRNALEGLAVAAHEPTSSLVVRATPEGHALVRDVVNDLDLRPPQVAIEVAVLEIRVGEERELGLNYFLTIGDPESNPDDVFGFVSRVPEGGFPDIVETPTIDADFAGRVRQEVMIPIFGPGGETEVLFPLYQVLLTADEGEVESRILMRPHFVATNGEEQEFFVGENIPIPVEAAETDTPSDPFNLRTNIEREDVGLQLRVKPTIGQAGGVGLEIELDVTQVGATGDSPEEIVLLQRRLSAQAQLRDGEYAVIGFTSRERELLTDERTPFFSDIPFLGWLFRSETKRKVQLYFLVTAQASIQRDPDDLLASSVRARLAMQRSLARVGDLRDAGRVRYAVLMATRADPEQAAAIAQRLPLVSGEDAVVRGWQWEGRSRFDVLVTGFRSLARAGLAATRLRETGYHPQVIAIPDPEDEN